MLPDYVSYRQIPIKDQGNTDQCTGYAFFGLLEEWIQNEYGDNVSFDYNTEYERMLQYRKDKKARTLKPWILKDRAFFEIGILEGFKTTQGGTVKIKGWKMSVPRSFDSICEEMLRSPVFAGVKLFEGHDFSPNFTDIIPPLPKKLKIRGYHAVFLKSFDRPNKLLEIQNSWGEPPKWITWEDLNKILAGCRSLSELEYLPKN